MATESYKKLVAWQKAFDLSIRIYQATSSFPDSERYGLSSQLRRAGVSVPSNIAEGECRRSDRTFLHFLNISYGSLGEIDTQLLIAKTLGFLDEKSFSELSALTSEVGKLLNGLIASLSKKLHTANDILPTNRGFSEELLTYEFETHLEEVTS